MTKTKLRQQLREMLPRSTYMVSASDGSLSHDNQIDTYAPLYGEREGSYLMFAGKVLDLLVQLALTEDTKK